jgi:TPR repeat/Glycosyltransferase family 9 (heptosyltransferase)
MTIQQAFDLALQHHQAGGLTEAEQLYRQILALQPIHISAMHHLGVIACQTGRSDIGIGLIRQSIALDPNYAEAHNNLGSALTEKSQFDEAIGAYRQAIALKPNYAEAYSNLGLALQAMGQLDEAIGAYRQAIALNNNFPDAHYNLALMLLLQGDFQRGWQEYEWRWKCKDFPSFRRNFTQPLWDGGPLETRTLLLHAEQGLGDAIQFIRYLPLVAQRGGRIIIECQAELQRLLRTMPVKCQIVTCGEPLPVFDLHSPLLSLPSVFGTTLDNVPKTVPYLHAAAQDAKIWQQRLDGHLPIVKVGLVWAGNLKPNRIRSIKLSSLAPLGQVPGVRFFSLQKGEASAQARTPLAGMEFVDWTAELKDFADTAALIANLDLVITVDTAVAHLAGAMGKPVWTLLPFVPDWRWLLEREDSPWYPSMRLFRQSVRGDWESVIKRVADALPLWIKNRA